MSRTTNMQNILWQHSGQTSTISQVSLNSGATNGDCNGEMVSVRDNKATNNDDITATPQQKVAQYHLNYKATKGRLTCLHHSMLLSCVCCLLLLLPLGRLSCSSRPSPPKLLHFGAIFAIFLPLRVHYSVTSWCERGIRVFLSWKYCCN